VRRTPRDAIGLGTALVVVTAVLPAFAGEVPEAYEKKCKVCHSIKGEGGKQAEKGGPLDGVGAKRDQAWLKAYLEDPKSKIPDGKMPKLKLTSEEFEAILAYMSTVK
jgi:mono/diheme cytochrome c family protein